MQGALDLDFGSVAGKGYIGVGVLGGGKRAACEAGGTGLNRSRWGSVSANETRGVFDSSWWSMVWEGHIGVGGPGGGNKWHARVGGTGPKTKTESPGLGFGQRNMGGFVCG